MRILVIGAGFSGAVIARQLAEAGHDIFVHDDRSHVAGNCHTKVDEETGILLHVYGPHIFHTSNEEVWKYISNFGDLEPYTLRVKATVKNSVYSLPVNLLTINQFFKTALSPNGAKDLLETKRRKTTQEAISFEDQALNMLGEELYQAFFFGYPIKQWGFHPRDLPASVLKRLPVRFNYDDNYFNHKFQGIPTDGYTRIIENILSHERISVSLNSKVGKMLSKQFDHTFYSGKLDEWFDFDEGELAYRTLKFENETHDGDFQGCPVMSYPDVEVPWTRITEHKHFTPHKTFEKTVISKEYSSKATSDDVPFYPIRLVDDLEILSRYIDLAKTEKNVTFVGRLGTYRYLDMDVTIFEALETARTFLKQISENLPMPNFVFEP